MTERTVVITGGGKGIGEAISRAFDEDGYRVLIASRSDSGLADELGDRARFVQCDVTEPDDLHAAARAAVDWTGQLDVFINNAGISAWRPVDEIDAAFWNEMLAVNLSGAFFGCQAAAEHLPRGGSIVNISSLAGQRGSANNTAYCAAKFGVNGVTQSLAKELGARGIRVNAVCPVYVSTDGLLEALDEPNAPPAGQPVDQYLADFAGSQTALGVLPAAEEVAQACLYLASDGASAITGQCINVDCGVFPR
jgi:3-oxoacyl-[acyl-carrier protein] reductase/meso-butanediol dehydrogenase/(S,S)-butanediol dehydrogenase/diacetyl reductase